MRKILAVLLAAVMLCSLIVSVSAEIPNEEVEALKFTTAPKLDGVITEAEWGKATVVVKESQATTQYVDSYGVDEDEANLYFNLWLRWDETYYYIGVTAPDTTHGLAKSEGSLWNGDAIQMGFDPEGPNSTDDKEDPWSGDYTNMAFGLVSGEGNTLSSWAWSGPCENGQVEGAKYNIKRDNGITTYEIAIPWDSIGVEQAKVGDIYGAVIARVLCDDEESGYNGWISWGTGILGRSSVDEDVMCGSNGIRLSATSATGAAAATTTTTTTTTPAASTTTATTTTTTAPVTADAGIITALITMVASAGAALSIKKRR